MKRKEQKMYIVRKYIMADSVSSAIRKEGRMKPHEVFIDDEWAKGQRNQLASAIGFEMIKDGE